MQGLILAALLATATTTAPTTATPQGAVPSVPAKIPASVWRFAEGGEAEHLQTGLRCPAAMGDYSRGDLTTYDGFGLDVSCGYNGPKSAITVYLTRGVNIDAAYAEAKKTLVQQALDRHPENISDGHVLVGGIDWLKADYTEDGGVRSDIWMAGVHGWMLEYRVTYLAANVEAVSAKLADVTAQVRASAGARLDLCAKSSPPERPGKLITNRESAGELGMTGALLGAIAASQSQDKASQAEPITFCLEAAAPGKDINFLSWRGVTPAGEDAKVDRLTPMTLNAPPSLETALDGVSSLILSERTGGKAQERWSASMGDGPRTSIYAYYDRRPSAEVLAPLMVRILKGEAKPIGGYSADGKNVSVTLPPTH